MITFDCEGCGYQIHDLSHDTPPKSGFCFSCEMLNDLDISLDEFWLLHRHLSPPIHSSAGTDDAGKP